MLLCVFLADRERPIDGRSWMNWLWFEVKGSQSELCSGQSALFSWMISTYLFLDPDQKRKKIIKEKRNKLRTWFALRSSVVIILTISVHCFVWHKAYFSSLAVCLTSAGWPFPLLRLLPRSEEVMRTGCTIQFLSTTF